MALSNAFDYNEHVNVTFDDRRTAIDAVADFLDPRNSATGLCRIDLTAHQGNDVAVNHSRVIEVLAGEKSQFLVLYCRELLPNRPFSEGFVLARHFFTPESLHVQPFALMCKSPSTAGPSETTCLQAVADMAILKQGLA